MEVQGQEGHVPKHNKKNTKAKKTRDGVDTEALNHPLVFFNTTRGTLQPCKPASCSCPFDLMLLFFWNSSRNSPCLANPSACLFV